VYNNGYHVRNSNEPLGLTWVGNGPGPGDNSIVILNDLISYVLTEVTMAS
jgi:hypothetical protein